MRGDDFVFNRMCFAGIGIHGGMDDVFAGVDMKYFWILVLFTGCGSIQRACVGFTGEFMYKCSKSGVEYVQSDSGTALHVDKDGKPVVCK